jgi:hypothetical protein
MQRQAIRRVDGRFASKSICIFRCGHRYPFLFYERQYFLQVNFAADILGI